MRGSIATIVAAALCVAAAPLAAQETIDPAADETFLALGDSEARMTVPVSIDGSGPYRFIIDTGSERTVVSRQLARHLKLGAGSTVRVVSMTGARAVDTVIVPALGVSKIARMTVTAPALEGLDIGAPGLLGVDSLQGHAVSIDFDRNLMSLRPVARKRAPTATLPGEVVVIAKNRFGQLIVTDAHYRRHRISVIVDTGSPVTIGNTALLRLMKAPPAPLGTISLVSVTGETLQAEYALVDRLEIGDIDLRGVPMGFADVLPFARFGLRDDPALLLGMDILRLFRSVQIDFVSRQVRFLVPRSAALPTGA